MSSHNHIEPVSHKFIREFIEMYRSLPALWKIRSKFYFDKQAKSEAYEKLVSKFKEIDPNADRDTVKRKINSIRTTFRKEWRKVQNSKSNDGSGESVYKPSLWYYDSLLFLCDELHHGNFDESSSSSPSRYTVEEFDTLCKQESLDIDADDDIFEDNYQESDQETSKCDEPRESTTPWPMTRTPISPVLLSVPPTPPKKAKVIEEVVRHPTESGPNAEDEFHYIAKVWALKLRRMSQMQKLFAEKLVNDVLFEGEMGCLSRASVVVVEPKTTELH